MDDLFELEQQILDKAVLYSKEVTNGAEFDLERYNELVKEYGRLLRQLRRATKISDRTTGTLYNHRNDLLDKVHFDALTGIYNRRYLEESLKTIVKVLSRSGGVLSVMMLDVDFFKKYNDTYGHSEGDTCLKTVAGAISGCLSRTDDFAARYGGEEFAVILPNTDESGARVMANKILDAIRDCRVPHEKNEPLGIVTISIGVTSVEVTHNHSGSDLIKRADEALYQSKQTGRNRYTYIEYNEV